MTAIQTRPDLETPLRRDVVPLAGAAPYIGGKRNLASRVTARIDQIPHSCYAEPFVGMGGVFFRRRTAPKKEVINDVSRDVSTFFRVLQRHFVALVEMMRWTLTSRAEFERLVATNPATLTDLERAARFYYLQRTAFGGKVAGRNYGVSMDRPAAFDITRLVPDLQELHERLAGVDIENLPYQDFIARYDRPTTLFYLDPPYYGCERDYGAGVFDREDFTRMAEQLAKIQGRFVLSINDVAAVREVFAAFKQESLATTYSLPGGNKSKKVSELLITNV
ncbi:MAG: DNA adenine methylase [Gemmatimonadaceae bacterium]